MGLYQKVSRGAILDMWPTWVTLSVTWLECAFVNAQQGVHVYMSIVQYFSIVPVNLKEYFALSSLSYWNFITYKL